LEKSRKSEKENYFHHIFGISMQKSSENLQEKVKSRFLKLKNSKKSE